MTESDAALSAAGQTCRRFHIGDALTLVAAVAVGLALARAAFSGCYPRRPVPAGFRHFYAIECGHAAAFFGVASLTVAFLPLRLRRPRPPLARVMGQPGAAACCTSIVQLVVGEAAVATSVGEASLSNFVFVLSPLVGVSVAWVWMMLWFNGWWRPEPGWVDGLGRVLGVGWVALPLVLGYALLF